MANEKFIYLPKIVEVEAPNLHVGVKGRFQIFKGKEGQPRELVADWFDNLILNSGLDLLGTEETVIHGVYVGTSNVEPDVGQTALLGYRAYSDSTIGVSRPSDNIQTVPPYRVLRYFGYRFGQGAASGNLAEVGIGRSNNKLFARSLIKDEQGNPTTITVLSDEYLDVIYGIEIYPPLTDSQYTIDISGETYECTTRAAYCGSFSKWLSERGGITLRGLNADPMSSTELGPITATLQGTASTSRVRNPGYSAGTFAKSGDLTWDFTLGNISGGIGGFRLDLGYNYAPNVIHETASFQTLITPKIPKDVTKILTLNFSWSWGRYVAP